MLLLIPLESHFPTARAIRPLPPLLHGVKDRNPTAKAGEVVLTAVQHISSSELRLQVVPNSRLAA
jgi:hypothetical protein